MVEVSTIDCFLVRVCKGNVVKDVVNFIISSFV